MHSELQSKPRLTVDEFVQLELARSLARVEWAPVEISGVRWGFCPTCAKQGRRFLEGVCLRCLARRSQRCLTAGAGIG